MLKMKQTDIFGKSIDIEDIQFTERKGRIPIQEQFRKCYGYKKGFYCKNCVHFGQMRYNRTYYKCEKIGISSSKATDIRVHDIACNLYEESVK
jgi:hypothetical protein